MCEHFIFKGKQFKIKSGIVLLSLIFLFTSINAQQFSTPSSPWDGLEIFKSKGCNQCHSVYGEGGKGGPDLGKNKFYGTYLELAALMWNHFPKMFKRMQKLNIQYPEFTNKEMTQLIAYLSFIRYRGEPGHELLGKKLLRSKGCFSCHKFGGEGGDLGPNITANVKYLSPLMLVESMWNHGPNLMEAFQKNNIKRPEFKGDDIIHLAAGIRAFIPATNKVPVGSYDLGDPSIGKKLIDGKGCLKCHSINGHGGILGPDFAQIDFNYSVLQIAGKMWNHGPEMWKIMKTEGISFPNFEGGEMADVIAYLYALNLIDVPGDSAKGYHIISEKGCLSCHSLNKQGGGISKDFVQLTEINTPLAMITTMWNHAPAMHEKQLNNKLRWPELNGREMADLYSYLGSISSSPPDINK